MIAKKILVLLLVVLVSLLPVLPVMAEDKDVTGSFQVEGALTVTLTSFPPSMDPYVEQTVIVHVQTAAGTLADLTSIVFKAFLCISIMGVDTPTVEEFNAAAADIHTCAVITWTPPDTWSMQPAGTLWALGSCSHTPLDQTSGDFTFKFTPSKVAQFSDSFLDQWWAIAAKAVKVSNEGYGAVISAMNPYTETYLEDTSVAWGSVMPGMSFDANPPSMQSLTGGIKIISNHDYAIGATSGASWGGSSALDQTGLTTSPNQFALKVNTEANLATASDPLRSTNHAYLKVGTTITPESGDTWPVYIFLQLASVFDAGNYSGTITFSGY